ncbi:AEC family transporter [Roseomonas mucosa]|uniref:AEC family transporter n=1 Tax=Roseomonas mucosa TaxID=207340 RepID=UPI002B40ACB4|nr:AEC family transporter [Roseomonas mucosa]QDD97026.1 Transporter [Roseomonas mucosa]
MLDTIIAALLPIVITLMLGFAAGWHHDFDAKQASVLNRMVMLYALPLSLFAGMVGTPRDQVLAQGPLALAIIFGMAGGYLVAFVVAHYLLQGEIGTSALRALAIAGPAVPFVGVPVLGQLFGAVSAVPIAVAGLVMNLIQVPVTLMLLSASTASRNTAGEGKPASVMSHVTHALREPVVWAPLLALAIVLLDLPFPAAVRDSLQLLGRSTGGVALFASGIVLWSRSVSFNLPVGLLVLLRNIVMPAIVLGYAILVGLPPDTLRESVVTMAIPAASIIVILAVQYQVAEQEMASTLFFSTLLSVLTMGAFIWLTH